MSIDGTNGQSDQWTGMPLEDTLPPDIAEPPATVLAGQAIIAPSAIASARRKSSWSLADLVWKLMAAGSDTTSPTILATLALDESARIRKRVAANQQCPPDALAMLSDDADAAVRAAVASNEIAPIYLLQKLSSDQDVSVRFAIAANSKMPDAILLSLYLDPDPYVADRASQTMAS